MSMHGKGVSCAYATKKSVVATLKQSAVDDTFIVDARKLDNHPKLAQILQSALDTYKLDAHAAADITHREAYVFKASSWEIDGKDAICFSYSFPKVKVSPENLGSELYQAILDTKLQENSLLGLFKIAQSTDEL